MTGSCSRLKVLKPKEACSAAVRACSEMASSGSASGAGTARDRPACACASLAPSSAGFLSCAGKSNAKYICAYPIVVRPVSQHLYAIQGESQPASLIT